MLKGKEERKFHLHVLVYTKKDDTSHSNTSNSIRDPGGCKKDSRRSGG